MSSESDAEAADVLAWPFLDDFVRTVEKHDLHGLHFQHVALCERRAWQHMRRIDYAHLDERMALGSVLHAVSRPRDDSVAGLYGLMPDRIDWAMSSVCEAKGGAGAVDAVSDQTAFYAVMLSHATRRLWRAVTHLIQQKRERPVAIDGDRLEKLRRSAERLASLAEASAPPPALRIGLCDSCSYRHLCWE
jgi:CRISPR-associated exonuclease Cas4